MPSKAQILLTTLRGQTASVTVNLPVDRRHDGSCGCTGNGNGKGKGNGNGGLFETLLQAAEDRDTGYNNNNNNNKRRFEDTDTEDEDADADNEDCFHFHSVHKKQKRQDDHFNNNIQFWHQGRHLKQEDDGAWQDLFQSTATPSSTTVVYLDMRIPILGGIDRQNRVGSKFGGGGQSSQQQGERERKERLKQLALESIDLAKDPYLMRNHLGTYECKLCLTLHTNEANYLAHTQGKKHQQGLAKRAHMEKLRAEKEGTNQMVPTTGPTSGGSGGTILAPGQTATTKPKVRIGRPAYQVFKSRDADTNQRCLSFELSFPELTEDIQPRHRFMSAFEQTIERPPDRRYQYLLFAAEPYETVAFKIPNEPIDKEQGRFVTHWDADDKKFTVTLYFMEPSSSNPTTSGIPPPPPPLPLPQSSS